MIIKQYTVLESLYVGAEKDKFCRIPEFPGEMFRFQIVVS